MNDEDWDELVSAIDELESGSDLLTPVSDRRFRIETVESDRVAVRFRDSGEQRPLRRDQFDALVDRLEEGSVRVDDLQPLIEPYAVVLTLSGEFGVEDGTITRDSDDEAPGAESPYVLPASEARTPPERVHDDSLLLADLLDRLDADDPSGLDTESATDLYVLCSEVQRGSDRLRGSARESLLDRLGPDQQLHGRYGTVRRTTRERRRAKDDETVLDTLDEYGVPREWVLGVDEERLEIVASVTDVPAEEVFDVEESVYVQKTGVDEAEKGRRLQGLRDRLDELEDERAEAAIRDDLNEIEDRLEEALAAG